MAHALLRVFTTRVTCGSTFFSTTAVSPKARASVTGSALSCVRVTGTMRVVSSSTMVSGLILARAGVPLAFLWVLVLFFVFVWLLFSISPPEIPIPARNIDARGQTMHRAVQCNGIPSLDDFFSSALLHECTRDQYLTAAVRAGKLLQQRKSSRRALHVIRDKQEMRHVELEAARIVPVG